MSAVVWPETLPLAQADQHSYTQGNNLLQTNMTSGKLRSRAISTSADDTLNVAWQFDEVQAAIFEGWFKHYAGNGENWITMPIKVAAGVIDHQVKFKAPYQPMTSLPGGRFMKTAQLLIQNRQVIDQDVTDYLINNSFADLEAAAAEAEGMTI